MREKRHLRGPTYCSRPCFYRRYPRTPLLSEDGTRALIPLLDKHGDVKEYAIVDATDADWAAQWSWSLHDNRCAVRMAWENGRTRTVRMHRALMGLEHGNALTVDHINRNPLDNRRSNLRVVTLAQNAQNKGARAGATSQYRGVYWSSARRAWCAAVSDRGRTYQLGTYDTEEKAAEAARRARSWLLPYSPD